MKKSYLFAAAIMAAAWTSCSQDEHLNFAGEDNVCLTGVMETIGSRTALDAANNVVWNQETDEVSAFMGTNTNRRFKINSIDGNGKATFEFVSLTKPETSYAYDCNYAIYPYSAENAITEDGKLTAPVSAEYTFTDKASSIATALMVAQSTGTSFNFTNAQGILRVRLNAEVPEDWGKVTSIKFTSASNRLSGTAEMTYTEEITTPEAVIADNDNAGYELNVTLATPTELPAKQDNQFAEFYVPIVPTTFEEGDLTMVVTFENDKTYPLDINATLIIGRKQIKGFKHTIKTGEIDGVIDDDTENSVSSVEELLAVLATGGSVVLSENITLTSNITIAAGATSSINLNGYTLSTAGNSIVVNGNLTVAGGTVAAQAGESELDFAFAVANSGTLNIESDATVTAKENGTAAVYMEGGELNVEGTIEVEGTNNNGVFVYGGTEDITINGTISAEEGAYAIYQLSGTSNVTVGEEGTLEQSMLGSSGTMNLVYSGDTKPSVSDDGTAVTLNIYKSTGYEGIYQSSTNARQYYITSKNGLMNLYNVVSANPGEGRGYTITLMDHIDMSGETWKAVDTMWMTFDGNNHTISNLTCVADTHDQCGLFAYAGCVTIKNLTLSNVTSTGHQAGAFIGNSEGSKLENCVLSGKNTINYSGISSDGGYNGIGALIGWNTAVTLENVEIASGATVDLCINDMSSLGTLVDYFVGYGKASTGSVTNNGTVTINGATPVASTNELTTAINNGVTSLYLVKGTYKLPSLSSKDITVSGTEETVIEVTGETSVSGSTITFNGVTIQGATSGIACNHGYTHAKKVVYNDCVINNMMATFGVCEFNNCTFNVSGNMYSLWTWGSSAVSFTGCTFNCDGKALLVYLNGAEDEGTHQTVTITDCTFNDNGDDTVTSKAAIEITSTYAGRTYDVYINNTKVNGFSQTVPGTGDFKAEYGSVENGNLGTNVWGNKCQLSNEYLNVVIDEVDVY